MTRFSHGLRHGLLFVVAPRLCTPLDYDERYIWD
jgi:hypothetical protein